MADWRVPMMTAVVRTSWAFALLTLGFFVGRAWTPDPVALAAQNSRVFELRTYTTHEGKLDALHARFRDHTMKFFEKHGMENIGYWVPQDPERSGNTLIYLLSHSSRDAAKASWAAFTKDPGWQKAKAESEAQGQIVSKVESVFLTPTDYSGMK
jgi:hypothetical protein